MDEVYTFACLAALIDDPYQDLPGGYESDSMGVVITRVDRALTTIAATHRTSTWNAEMVSQLGSRPVIEVHPARERSAACAACGKSTTCGFMITLSGPKVDGPACLAREGEPTTSWMDRLPWSTCLDTYPVRAKPPSRKYRVGESCMASMLRTHAANFFKLYVLSDLSRAILSAHTAGVPRRAPGSRVLKPMTTREARALGEDARVQDIARSWVRVYSRLVDVVRSTREPLLTSPSEGLCLVAFTSPMLYDATYASSASSESSSAPSSSPAGSPSEKSWSGSSDSSSDTKEGDSSDSSTSTDSEMLREVASSRRVVLSDSSQDSPRRWPLSRKRASPSRRREESGPKRRRPGPGAYAESDSDDDQSCDSGYDGDRTETDEEMMMYQRRAAERAERP